MDVCRDGRTSLEKLIPRGTQRVDACELLPFTGPASARSFSARSAKQLFPSNFRRGMYPPTASFRISSRNKHEGSEKEFQSSPFEPFPRSFLRCLLASFLPSVATLNSGPFSGACSIESCEDRCRKLVKFARRRRRRRRRRLIASADNAARELSINGRMSLPPAYGLADFPLFGILHFPVSKFQSVEISQFLKFTSCETSTFQHLENNSYHIFSF